MPFEPKKETPGLIEDDDMDKGDMLIYSDEDWNEYNDDDNDEDHHDEDYFEDIG